MPPTPASAYAETSAGVFRRVGRVVVRGRGCAAPEAAAADGPQAEPGQGHADPDTDTDTSTGATDGDQPALRPSSSVARDAEHNAVLDSVREDLADEARAYARRIGKLQNLARLSAQGTEAGVAQFPQLEMAGSWSISQHTATRWADDAERFSTCLPTTLELLADGRLLVPQAQVLLTRTRHCSEDVCRKVEQEVLPAGASLCPSDLRKRVDRAVLRITSELLDLAEAEQQHADAVAGRRTFARPDAPGTGVASALLSAEQLVAWQQGLDALERRERLADRAAGVQRTADQRRADLFAALPAMVLAGTAQDRAAGRLATGPLGDEAGAQQPMTAPAAVGQVSLFDRPLAPWTFTPETLCAQVVLSISVPVATVLEASREPGHLEGFGPVSAEHVRLVRPHSLRRVLVDATTGVPLAVDDAPVPAAADPAARREQVRAMLSPSVVRNVDEPQHDPSAHLARLVDLRDQHCLGPGCSSRRCDRDHGVRHPDGPTSESNIRLLSRRCHRAKHHGWHLERHADGSSTWTSPLGRTYRRPGPHPPPPRADLYAPPPPVRPAPVPVDPRWVSGHAAPPRPDAPGPPPGAPRPPAEELEPPF